MLRLVKLPFIDVGQPFKDQWRISWCADVTFFFIFISWKLFLTGWTNENLGRTNLDRLCPLKNEYCLLLFSSFSLNLHLVVLHRPTVLSNQNFFFPKTKLPKGKACNIYAHDTYVVSFEYRPSMQRHPFLTVHQFASMFSTQARTTFHEPWVTRIRESCARGATLENMAGPRLYAAQGDSTRERGLPCRRVWNLLKISNGRNEWHSTARRPK